MAWPPVERIWRAPVRALARRWCPCAGRGSYLGRRARAVLGSGANRCAHSMGFPGLELPSSSGKTDAVAAVAVDRPGGSVCVRVGVRLCGRGVRARGCALVRVRVRVRVRALRLSGLLCVCLRARVRARVSWSRACAWARACACAWLCGSACAPAAGTIHLGWVMRYSCQRACYMCLRSGCGSVGNAYNMLRGLRELWGPSECSADGDEPHASQVFAS